jgi:imidazolonepropionase-like amidohydrolase
MGAGDERGTIEVGKVADLLLVQGDPRSGWSRLGGLRCVVRAGRPQSGCDAAR